MRFRRQYTLFPRKTKHGKIWYFRVYLPNGTRRAKSTGCSSKEKAIHYVESLLDSASKLRLVFESDIQKGYDIVGLPAEKHVTGLTFEEYSRGWWKWDSCPYVLERRRVGTPEHPAIKRQSVDSYYKSMKNHLLPYFGNMMLEDIHPEDVSRFLIMLKETKMLKPNTVNQARSVLCIMLKKAKQEKLISDNPVEETLTMKVTKKTTNLIDDEEWGMLFNPKALDEIWDGRIMHYALNLTASLTGMRKGELLSLTIEDISQTAITDASSWNRQYGLGTTKTSKERTIPITAMVYELLLRVYKSHQPGKNHFIFSLNGDKPINEGYVNEVLYCALARIGISEEKRKERGLTFHSWRHFFTTSCVKAGMHPEAIRALTGHSSNEMLHIYTDLEAKDLAGQVNEIQNRRTNGIS